MPLVLSGMRSLLRGAAHAAFLSTLIGISSLVQAQTPDFGPNVYIFTPSTPTAQITAALNAAYFQGLGPNDDPTLNQFSTNRYAFLFMPGTYNVQAPVGYYVSVAGLGQTPGAVVINGFLTPNFGNTSPGVNVTDTFWRSMENMSFNPTQNTAQDAAPDTLQWGVSQGAPLRRVQINGSLELADSFCGFASGGFIADSVVTGNVNPCSQQQWYTRNSDLGSFTGGVWNMVFSGVNGAPPQGFPATPITTLATTPVSREKPFLYVDSEGNYNVFVPAVQHNSTGVSWSNGMGPGYSKPIADFFIAQPTSTVTQINQALADGKGVIFTPGVYKINQPINVLNANAVILGLGYATLVPQMGTPAFNVADVDGVQISSLIIDAGPVNSPVLFQLGPAVPAHVSHAANPISMHDLTFRVGGATPGKSTTSFSVDSDDVILDNIWCWRADHGNGVGWTANTAAHGLVVNGDNVTALGLAVEHYQEDQVQWNGSGGETIFYQSEDPYDPPSQAAWMDQTSNGFASYHVTTKAQSHTAYGLGVYSFFDQGVNIVQDSAISVPDTPNMSITDALTVFLNGSGSITHVIDNVGDTVSISNDGVPSDVPFFP